MSYDYELQDGYTDQLSGEKISFHREDEPWKVGFKPKNPGSVLNIPTSLAGIADAIDFGAGGGLTQAASGVCGEYVALYFPPVEEGSNTDLWPEEWSAFLSQVEELHNAMPPYLGVFSWGDIVIDSLEFKAPEGIFNYFSSIQPTFTGSTFRIAPRVFGDVVMSITTSWPPGAGDFLSISYPWEPFAECPNLEKIEFQGTLGDYCEKIYGSFLTYKDEDGYERVEAYPDGGRPKIIANAIQLDSFQMDSGSSFPMWDCSQLEICISPVFAREIVLPTRSGGVSVPIGPDVRSATNLKYYFNGIKSVVRGYHANDPLNRQPCPLVFGLKLLGIDLPEGAPALQYVEDTHLLWRHQAQMGEDYVGISATPQVVKDYFNYALGSALSDFYGNNTERLLMPETELPIATHVNRYAEVQMDEDYFTFSNSCPYYYIRITPNGTAGAIEIPKLRAPNLKILNGWLENTLSFARTGELEFSSSAGQGYSIPNVQYHLPAPPANPGMVVRNGYKRTCAYLSGKSITHYSSKKPGSISLVFGVAGEFEDDTYPVAVLNIKNLFKGNSDVKELLKEQISERSYIALASAVDDENQLEFDVSISRDGVSIEPLNTSGYSHVFSWQDGLFYKAEMDPTTVDNILIPVGGSTKVDGAYRGALDLATPLHSKVKYLDDVILDEPVRNQDNDEDNTGGFYRPSFTMIMSSGVDEEIAEQFKYKLENIDIPVFQLTNRNNQAYNTWAGLFSYLVYGDIAGFKAARGIASNINVGGSTKKPEIASGDFLDMGVLNWRRYQYKSIWPEGWATVIPSPIENSNSISRGFATRLFREELPIYPGEQPLDGDPIFIDFSKVGSDSTWTLDGYSNIEAFRFAVRPETQPII